MNPGDISSIQRKPITPQTVSTASRAQGAQVPQEPRDGFLSGLADGVERVFNKVKAPIQQGAKSAGKWAKTLTSATVTALRVAPTLGTLVAASALAKAEGLLPGREEVSAIEWLRARTPDLFNKTLDNVFKLVGTSTVNSTGLSVGDLMEIEEHIYKSLAPEVGEDGKKRPAHFISQLAAAPFRAPGAPYAAFVYLGEGRAKESKEVMKLWNGDMPPGQNPYPKESDLHRVWEVLEEKAGEKKLPVFIDLDGDARTFTSTEYISKEIMNSMVTRHNQFGDGFQDAGLFYTQMHTRQESFYQVLDPWVAEKKPELHREIESVKRELTPPWLGGSKLGLGPFPTPASADKAYHRVESLASKSGQGAAALTDFADMLVALDRDTMTGTMTHWIKLLKESGEEKREKLLGPLARAWVDLNVNALLRPQLAVPEGAPKLKALEGPPPEHVEHPYDRAIALGEVVDHTLDGLGVFERRHFMRTLRKELRKHLDVIQGQDARFASLLGDRYEGIDLRPVLAHRHSCADAPLKESLDHLKSTIHHAQDLSPREQAELHRHYSMLDWLINSQKRYGDVQFGLIGHSEAFMKDPLAVSQYFDQSEEPDVVTTLGPGPCGIRQLGDQTCQKEMKVSIFREGGGGKGLAYPVPSRALKAGLKSLDFQLDDSGGNSAGIIPSLLEAAGFNDDEIEEISFRLDFKEFNADAIPLLGGTDPKVGGINQTGLFSSQKMYKELHAVLAKKLGIHGRPVLFRDLPGRLSMAATVMNTDLPADEPLRKLIDGDKRMIMSSDTTPNFDVVGAVTASTAVPGYFNSPQMQVARPEKVDGKLRTRLYRLQFVDGGVVDNFPISAAKKETDGKTALVVVPVFYEAVDPETGKKSTLTTLNFDDTELAAVNKKNSDFYQNMMPKLDAFLARASEQGYSRVVLAMNLTDLDEQTQPIIQGQTAEETERLLSLADGEGMQHLSAAQGRSFMKKSVHGSNLVKNAVGGAFDLFMDGHSGESDEYEWKLKGSHSRVGKSEEQNIFEVIRGVGSSALAVNKEQEKNRLFEA